MSVSQTGTRGRGSQAEPSPTAASERIAAAARHSRIDSSRVPASAQRRRMAASAPPGGPAAESAGPDAEGIAPLVPIAIDAQREQDRLLPEANIVRIMKRALPDGTKVSKEAKAAVVEAASEFVAFVTQEGERCTAQNRARRALVWQLHVPETPARPRAPPKLPVSRARTRDRAWCLCIAA